jgi:hypothetical protein
MRRRVGWLVLIAMALAAAAGAWALVSRGAAVPTDAVAVPRPPRIRPDYSGIVMPPNIAPLNFVVREQGGRFFVRIRSEEGSPIEIASRSPKITIPERRWRSLLESSRGKDLRFDVYAEMDGQWRSYQPIINRVAQDAIDDHVVYRLTGPIHNWWIQVGVYQRDLTTYRESAVLEGAGFGGGCVNCHSFASNRPDPMLIGTRSERFGSAAILVSHGKAKKIGTKFGYTAWHPSGRLAVYSINKVRQFFHAAGPETRDVIDLDAGLAYYSCETENARLVPRASDKQRLETYPAWSPDGRYLYYSSAPILWTNRDAAPPERYAEVKYDLMRISYDVDSDRWGEPEMVLSARETGLSILEPRISPDGRFLLFCMCRYGCFPIYQPTSDLYMMDLDTREYTKLEINSPFSESWHSWSSNSRWIAFSSRRRGGVFTRCYLSYVDETGKAHKPFILPRSDPESYDSLLKSISVPELITGPVPVGAEALARCARSGDTVAVDGLSGASPLAGASEPWNPAER